MICEPFLVIGKDFEGSKGINVFNVFKVIKVFRDGKL